MAAAATSGGCAPLSGPPDLSLALREALLKVLENRPEDPVSFLAEYFESAAAAAAAAAASEGAAEKPGPRLQQEQVAGALKQLLLCHYSRPAFSRNVASAFQILSCQAGKRKKPGLKGRAYTELLRQICGAADLSSCSLVHKLQCWDHEAVPFSVFRHGVLTCFVYLEFVMVSRRLFEAVAESGEADRPVCQALLEALKDAVSVGGSSGASGYLDAGSKLGPDQLARAMEQAVRLRKNQSTAAMTQEEFILLTAPLFIQKVKSIC